MSNKEIEKQLGYEKISAWTDKKKIESLSEDYRAYLDDSKTERECVETTIALAKQSGFSDLSEKIKSGERLKTNDKVYYNHQNKCVVLFVMGSSPLNKGLNITAAHIDSPRLDLKAVPLYEESNLALLKTHYYGGIKKYQWTAVPLSMHGIIYTKEGTRIKIDIGEKDTDPVFFVSDLLVHLSADQLDKKTSAAITGEQLNVIAGSIPLDDEDVSKKVKFQVLKLLNEQYGIAEEDFLSAEIEIVPAGKSRDVGFDRGLIGAYGHDDKVCAYPALRALLDTDSPQRTCACILADKEEIGSVGSTGLAGKFFENIASEVYELFTGNYSELDVKRMLAQSYVLSMDVTCAYDPNFPEAFDKSNTAIIGSGTVMKKYSGAKGKAGTNDAHSEYLIKLRMLFHEHNIVFQTGELGKVDQGGGGTVAYMLANYGAMTVDFAVPVLSMHAPYELISKADLYQCCEGAKAFYQIGQ
ncbi:MAG: aminopeptidase [Anaerofustis sp.]